MDSSEDNYGKAMELLEYAKREADLATERNNQTAAFEKRIAELENALIDLYDIIVPEAQPFPGADPEFATHAAKTLPFHVEGLLRLLQGENERLRELLDSATSVIRQTCEARNAAMRDSDKKRYLGRGSDWILTDLFRRVHEAEDRLAVSSEGKGTDEPHTN